MRVPPLEERTAMYGREDVRGAVEGSDSGRVTAVHLIGGGKGEEEGVTV